MTDYKEIEFEGLHLLIYRDPNDGALRISINTEEVGLKDEWPASGVPKLRLCINECTAQLDSDGNWGPSIPYPDHTVLDHIVVGTQPAGKTAEELHSGLPDV